MDLSGEQDAGFRLIGCQERRRKALYDPQAPGSVFTISHYDIILYLFPTSFSSFSRSTLLTCQSKTSRAKYVTFALLFLYYQEVVYIEKKLALIYSWSLEWNCQIELSSFLCSPPGNNTTYSPICTHEELFIYIYNSWKPRKACMQNNEWFHFKPVALKRGCPDPRGSVSQCLVVHIKKKLFYKHVDV